MKYTTMKYDKEYFIKKFEDIPEDEIGKGEMRNHCALWHCGCDGEEDYVRTDESDALILLFGGDPYSESYSKSWGHVTRVNDITSDLGSSPKQRILNKLKSL